ncbi:SAP domain-containing protein [Georgenia sp. SYP-B2076]|uniref:SAP domain-containing protein n=1 Tax=Georgenia sp. SYP-B2076 TaxID=2495881 RepID=UPI000F8C7D2B|nr:SAP domain-containing protein [Georgenia sp. SYP-B2076]
MDEETETRPPLSAALTGSELRCWSWRKGELVSLAQQVGVSTEGSKPELTARLVAALDAAAQVRAEV